MDFASTVGLCLIEEIKKLGVQQVFGIPGDMVINLFNLLSEDPELDLFTLSHEPSVGFAAIGAARATQQPAVACVTYGPGALNMLNAVACAYAEKVPLIIISGSPELKTKTDDFFWHHTVKHNQSQFNIYKEVTKKAIIIDNPLTARFEIQNVLSYCQKNMLPVYIEIPKDIVNQQIVSSSQKNSAETILSTACDDKINQAIEEIIAQLAKSKKPVIMAGVEIVRFNLVKSIVSLANELKIPLVNTMVARDFSPLDNDVFYGTYFGKAGTSDAEQIVLDSDLIILIGERLSDVNIGKELYREKQEKLIHIYSNEVKTPNNLYKNVDLSKIIFLLSKMGDLRKNFSLPEKNPIPKHVYSDFLTKSLTSKDVIKSINCFLNKNGPMPIISDTGIGLFLTLQIVAPQIIGASFYGTMGFAVPASIGYTLSTHIRPLVIVGDGAFQMTGQEICHCPRFGINPIFILLKNNQWGMEQLFHTSQFNHIPNWSYAKMAELWGGKGYNCKNVSEFRNALTDAIFQKEFSLIEVNIEKDELPEGFLAWIKEQKQEKVE